MRKLIKKSIAVLTLIVTLVSNAFPTLAYDYANAVDSTSALIIIDSVTGDIVQNAETVNYVINILESGENNGRYYLTQATSEVVNSVDNSALLIIENSETGDIIQNVQNNTYIINYIISGSGAKYRLKPGDEKYGRRDRHNKRDRDLGNYGNSEWQNIDYPTYENAKWVQEDYSIYDDAMLYPAPDLNVYGLSGEASSDFNYLTWYDCGYGNGYRLYRNEGYGYVSVSDFPLYQNYYVDEKAIDNDTVYTYCVALVTSPASVYGSEETGPLSEPVYVDRTPLKHAYPNETVIAIPIGSSYMYINDVAYEIDPGRRTTAQIISDRTFLPCRALIEAIGGTLYWDEYDKKVTAYLDGMVLTMWIGKKEIFLNNSIIYLDVAPILSNGRTFLPLRAFQNLGLSIDWDGQNQVAFVRYMNNQNY